MREREGAVRACALGVHDTLWDAFAVEVGEEVDVVEVWGAYQLGCGRNKEGRRTLEEEWSDLTDALCGVGLCDRRAVGGRVGRAVL